MARRPAAGSESILVARRIHDFVHEYAPTFLTSSHHTLKGYRDAITLYLAFLQGEGVDATSLGYVHLERQWIERWIAWLRDVRGCSPDTCNNLLQLQNLSSEGGRLSGFINGSRLSYVGCNWNSNVGLADTV